MADDCPEHDASGMSRPAPGRQAPRHRPRFWPTSAHLVAHAAAIAGAAGLCYLVWDIAGPGPFWPGPVVILFALAAALNAFGWRLPNDYDLAEEPRREIRRSPSHDFKGRSCRDR